MTRRKIDVGTEVTVMDGTRHLGVVRPVADEYRALDAGGHQIGSFPSRREAQRAVFEADQARTAVGGSP